MILGMPWLRATNPLIDWRKGTIEWRKPQLRSLQTSRPIKTPKEEETINVAVLCLMEDELDEEGEPTPVWINAKFTASQTLAAEDYAKKEKKPLHEVVTEPYHDYLALFREETSNLFPPKRPWDHKIKLKEGFTLKIFKTYMLSPSEERELSTFLDENVRLGRIRPSQSPMGSPFFFVAKKNGKL